MKTKYLASLTALGIVAVFCALFAFMGLVSQLPRQSLADEPNNNYLSSASFKYATSSVTTSATLVLATSTARQYAVISNDGPSSVSLWLSSNPTAGGTTSIPFYANQTVSTTTPCGFTSCATGSVLPLGGILLTASSTYTIDLSHLYTGAVYAVSDGQTSLVSVTASQ